MSAIHPIVCQIKLHPSISPRLLLPSLDVSAPQSATHTHTRLTAGRSAAAPQSIDLRGQRSAVLLNPSYTAGMQRYTGRVPLKHCIH